MFNNMNDWLDKSEYPFKPNFFTSGGHRLHYIDEGQGDIGHFPQEEEPGKVTEAIRKFVTE